MASNGISFVKVVDAGRRYTTVLADDGKTYTLKGDRNWRNNNPGNIEYGKFAKSMGAIGSDGRFAVFPSMEQGHSAQETLQFEGKNYSDKTISDAIKRYAPAFENNSTAYAAELAAAAGVPVTTKLKELSAAQRQAYLAAQRRVEGLKPGTIMGADGEAVSPDVAGQFAAIRLPPNNIPSGGTASGMLSSLFGGNDAPDAMGYGSSGGLGFNPLSGASNLGNGAVRPPLPRGRPDPSKTGQMFTYGSKPPGMLMPGNIDLNNRPVFFGNDGTYGTEASLSIGTDQGEVLIPTIINGRKVSNDDAIKHYMQTGENMGSFSSPDAADQYATKVHQRDQGLSNMPVPMPGRPASLSTSTPTVTLPPPNVPLNPPMPPRPRMFWTNPNEKVQPDMFGRSSVPPPTPTPIKPPQITAPVVSGSRPALTVGTQPAGTVTLPLGVRPKIGAGVAPPQAGGSGLQETRYEVRANPAYTAWMNAQTAPAAPTGGMGGVAGLSGIGGGVAGVIKPPTIAPPKTITVPVQVAATIPTVAPLTPTASPIAPPQPPGFNVLNFLGDKAKEAGTALGSTALGAIDNVKTGVGNTVQGATDLLKNDIIGTVHGRTILMNSMMGLPAPGSHDPYRYGDTQDERNASASARDVLRGDTSTYAQQTTARAWEAKGVSPAARQAFVRAGGGSSVDMLKFAKTFKG